MADGDEPTEKRSSGRFAGLVPKTEMSRADRTIEIAGAVLLAIATVAIAWSGYQATRWGGVQANNFATAGAERTESVRSAGDADTLTAIDVNLFTEWIDARAADDTDRADFYEERFRDEFKPAFREWLASKPLSNPDAAPVPFALDSYKVAAAERADDLEASADVAAATAREANQRGDNYVLAAVLFATVLFFAGISSKFTSRRLQAAGIAAAVVIFVAAFAWMLTMPISFGV
jgi:hypothetical protein